MPITESGLTPSPEERALIARVFSPSAIDADIRALLEYLNSLTTHRFTGIYRFDAGWVVSVALWDRQTPTLTIGANVKMKESYCWLTGLGDATYVIEDAASDPRLNGHAARDEVRSYAAVLLRDKAGRPWGTLCHFDFEPRRVKANTLIHLERFRPLIEELLVRDAAAVWMPDWTEA